MTKKQKLVEEIKSFLKASGGRVEHDIYLLRPYYKNDADAWYGKITEMWLDKDGTPKCLIWYWGTLCTEDISTLTSTNLGFVHEYLTKGYVIQ